MILVVGATGQLGGMIARRLLEQGEVVRVLARHNSPSEELAKQGGATSAQSLIAAGAQPIYGDLKERASLDLACNGVEILVTTANSATRGGKDNAETVDHQGNFNLIDAAKAARVRQFVFMSALPADINSPVPLFQAKAKTETYLHNSGIPYTILSPDLFMEAWVGMVVGMPLQAGLPITLVGRGNRRHAFISITDVAVFATAVIGHPAAMNQRLEIGGPEPLSWRDIVATIERVLDKQLPVRFIPPGKPVPGLPQEIGMVLAELETYDSLLDMADITRTFGIELTSIESFARGMLASAGKG